MKEQPNNVIAILISFTILIVGLIVGKFSDLLTIREFIISTILTSVLLLTVTLITGKIIQSKVRTEMGILVTNLKQISKNLTPHNQIIFNTIELMDMESNLNCSEVWVCTLDLSNDISDTGFFHDVVIKNIQKGIRYTYILPETNVILSKLPALKIVFKSNPNLLSIKLISESKYRSIAFSHAVIYNPTMASKRKAVAFLELPIEEKNLWVRFDNTYTYDLIGRIKKQSKI